MRITLISDELSWASIKAIAIATVFFIWGDDMKLLMILWLAIFVLLKLVRIITWSWWLVFIPLWIYLGMAALVFIVVAIVEALKDV